MTGTTTACGPCQVGNHDECLNGGCPDCHPDWVSPSARALAARDAWVQAQGGEAAIKRRMADPLLAALDVAARR